MLTISKIDSFDELLSLEKEWNSLLDRTTTNKSFLRFEWICNWWRLFGSNKQLFILLVKEDDKPIGIAPLMISHERKFNMTINKLEFIGMPLSDYLDFIISKRNKEVLQKIYDYLMENKDLWTFINLNRIPETSSNLEKTKEIFKSNRLFKVFNSDKCPSLIFDEKWKEFKKKLNNKKMRKRIKQLKKNGKISLSRCNENKKKAFDILNIFFQQHKERWNTTKTPSMFNNEDYKDFFKSILISLLERGEADMFYLTVDDKPIAIRFVFIEKDKLLTYTSSYDGTYADKSPGVIMNKFFLEYLADNRFKEFDYLRGGEKYKLRFTTIIKNTFKISIHKHTSLYTLDYLSSKIESKIKENEKLYNFFIKYEKKLRIF